MRALLVSNPKATAVSPGARDIITRALGSDLKLDVTTTQRRGHAADLARQARTDGLDVVLVLGGDGTVNEVVNGMLAAGPGPDVPALAVVPGGCTNVFARNIGLSTSPVEATSEILDALRAGRRRRLGLGQVDERWFTFCAGIGFDAEVVQTVERKRRHGRRATPALYLRSAVEQFVLATDRRRPTLTLERPGAEPVGPVFLAIVSNTAPWSYLGSRPVNPNPAASFDTGLDVLAPRRLGVFSTLRTVRQMLARRATPTGRHLVALHDVGQFTLVGDRPLAVQVDGDYVGERQRVTFRAVPNALDVIV